MGNTTSEPESEIKIETSIVPQIPSRDSIGYSNLKNKLMEIRSKEINYDEDFVIVDNANI